MLHELPRIINKAKFNCSGSISLSDAAHFGRSPGDLRQVHPSRAAREDQCWERGTGFLPSDICSHVLFKGSEK